MKNHNMDSRVLISSDRSEIDNFIDDEEGISLICVDDEYDGMRIDKYLSIVLVDYSRSQIQKLIKEDKVTVNKEIVKSNYKIKTDDEIMVYHPEIEDIEIKAENIKLNIVYEDNDLLVVNKEAGMVVHPAKGHYSHTLVNALLYYCQGLSGVNGPLRPGIVHRLDKDTTGLIVIAKNDHVHRLLSQQFQEREVIRKYKALVHGILPSKSGEIIAAIARHPTNRQRMAVDPDKGKDAITKFDLLEYIGEYSLLELELITGRTHQIRVHMEYIKHPIVGDPVYGFRKEKLAKRQLLHASYLAFRHPITNEEIELEIDIAQDFKEILQSIK